MILSLRWAVMGAVWLGIASIVVLSFFDGSVQEAADDLEHGRPIPAPNLNVRADTPEKDQVAAKPLPAPEPEAKQPVIVADAGQDNDDYDAVEQAEPDIDNSYEESAPAAAARKNRVDHLRCSDISAIGLETPLNCLSSPAALATKDDYTPFNASEDCPVAGEPGRPEIFGMTVSSEETPERVRRKLYCQAKSYVDPNSGTFRLRLNVESLSRNVELEFRADLWPSGSGGAVGTLPNFLTVGNIEEIRRRYWKRPVWDELNRRNGLVDQVSAEATERRRMSAGQSADVKYNPIIDEPADLELVYKPCANVEARRQQLNWYRSEFDVNNVTEADIESDYAPMTEIAAGKAFCLSRVEIRGQYKDNWSEYVRVGFREGACAKGDGDVVYDGRVSAYQIDWRGHWHDRREWLELARSSITEKFLSYFPDTRPALDPEHPVKRYRWVNHPSSKSKDRVTRGGYMAPIPVESWEDARSRSHCGAKACTCPFAGDNVFVSLDISYKPTALLTLSRGPAFEDHWEWNRSRSLGKELEAFKKSQLPLGAGAIAPFPAGTPHQ